MADSSAEGQANTTRPLADIAAAHSIPMFIGEGNSVSCGGYTGVSDVFGAALWAMDTLINQASIGVERWNFHGSQGNPYAAIMYPDTTNDTPRVLPLYYGLWAFSAATANHSVLHKVQLTTTNPFVKAYAVRADDGNGAWRVVLLHKDPSSTSPASATVTIVPPSGVTLTGAATLSRLAPGPRGINATADDAITWQGQTLFGSPDGSPQGPVSTESVPQGSDGSYVVTLPRASAAVLTLPAA